MGVVIFPCFVFVVGLGFFNVVWVFAFLVSFSEIGHSEKTNPRQ